MFNTYKNKNIVKQKLHNVNTAAKMQQNQQFK
jgi:hypothetical protein